MRSFNKARLIDIADKKLNPRKSYTLGKDGHLTEEKKIKVEKKEIQQKIVEPTLQPEQEQEQLLQQTENEVVPSEAVELVQVVTSSTKGKSKKSKKTTKES